MRRRLRSDDNIEATYQVTEFNGSNMQGDWELFVSDNAGQDTGQLVGWKLAATLETTNDR